MFGFKKKMAKQEEQKNSANIRVIPLEFYGAKDPIVHFDTVSKKEGGNNHHLQAGSSLGQEKIIEKKYITGGNSELAGLFHNKRFLYISGGILFLVILGAISWYYVNEAKKQIPAAEEKLPLPLASEITEEQPVIPTTTVEEVVEVTSTLEIATSTIEKQNASEEILLQFPKIFLTNSADVDNDLLTDLEEEIFGTDSGAWDTDGDGYYDGQEVFNLYNPKGTAPMKIIDSGLVQEYINPKWQYRLYYPVGWQVGAVDTESKQALFSSLTGDFIEVDVLQKKETETFVDWFSRRAEGQQYLDLQPFTNRFKEQGQRRSDDLAAYFVDGNYIFVLLYHPGTTGFIPYRHVFQLITQSFRPGKTFVEIPDQMTLPQPAIASQENNYVIQPKTEATTTDNFIFPE